METHINRLKATLMFQIVVGIILSIVMVSYTVSVGLESDASTGVSIAIGALLVAVIPLVPLVLVPFMSIRELDVYPEKGSLFINHFDSFIIIAFICFPIAIWQIFLLRKIKACNSAPAQS